MTAMRAAVLRAMGAPAPYAQSRPLRIETVRLQPPGRGEVRVRVRAAGLCHSDLSVIDGSRPRPLPMLLGHEATGEVVELGEGVSGLRLGDQVVFSFVPMCGHCDPCACGRPVLCEAGAAANARGTLLDGGTRLRLGLGDHGGHRFAIDGGIAQVQMRQPPQIVAQARAG